MDYNLLKKRIEIITDRIKEIGGEVQEIIIGDSASLEQIQEIEQQLGQSLPSSFRKVLQEFASHFSMRWFLPENIDIPEEFTDVFGGTPNWNLKLLPEFEEDRKEWIETVFSDPEDDFDTVWHNKLPFCEVGNGDYLAFDMNGDEDAPIIYLSHEDSEGHGYQLANNFIELLESWSRIAFVGPEDSEWLPFTSITDEGIDANSKAAERFRSWLGLQI